MQCVQLLCQRLKSKLPKLTQTLKDNYGFIAIWVFIILSIISIGNTYIVLTKLISGIRVTSLKRSQMVEETPAVRLK